ncbi:MAG: hypothetical protein IT378_20720 [Sandaracinaceae bacterium]|nr:hypothetical protein [Sandaracinaceae bacterium]
MTRALLWIVLLALGCESGVDPARPDTNVEMRNGCPVLRGPVAMPGDPIEGDTWATFAEPFFEQWCTRCHSQALDTPELRRGAPRGYDWDVEASVRAHLPEIRQQVGVLVSMPYEPQCDMDTDCPPTTACVPSATGRGTCRTARRMTCAERLRLVRWIDAAAP